ncbi:transcriptional regulator, MarR family [Marininema mesophilum]|uniref:Transcriptional regulator, MarR family n=1 Tax=Marininema mesophilum TaxID=1048340 RepID=A0A1H2Q6L4_9BACL|nr:ROK family transcriptional regulator [Marininema mesophilum]SDW02650.1 transcriptional regulator, MarR family [Marininema mesophilum]
MTRMVQTGSFRWMKSINKSIILNVIRQQGPIPRAEIAKVTQLTPPTVTNIVGELLDAGIVVECELGESTGGRKPILLRINASTFGVIGVYAGVDRIHALSADLDGNIEGEAEALIPPNPDRAVYIRSIIDVIHQLAAPISRSGRPLLGMGVGMNGWVDNERGISLCSPNLHLQNIPLRDILEREFAVPVEVENGVRTLAMGESWFGEGLEVEDFISVDIGAEVGAAFVMKKNLVYGPSFTAGELGHTTVDSDGPLCRCGNRGCLEVFASSSAMIKRVQEGLDAGVVSLLAHSKGTLTSRKIFEAARIGDAFAMEVLIDIGGYLGIGLANVVNLFNPRRIILCGEMINQAPFVVNTIRETVERRALATPVADVTILPTGLGKNGGAIGAFTLVLQKLFQPQH